MRGSTSDQLTPTKECRKVPGWSGPMIAMGLELACRRPDGHNLPVTPCPLMPTTGEQR
jgi:hypothetical protein